MTDYHVQISAPNNAEHFAKLIDSLEKGDKIVWNGRSEPFTITETAPHNGPGLDGIGSFRKTLRLENQTRENGAEFRLRFEEGSDHSLSPGSSGWDARCVVQRQIGDRAVNDGGWGRCTEVESLAHVNPVESAERDGEREVATDGSGHVCDACDESFRTLTRLRLHERDSCPQRETFDKIEPDAPDAGLQAAEGLLTCRACDCENPNADYDQTVDVADDDYHLIVEFDCRRCGFENENRVVATGVDSDDLENLPPHLQPDDDIATDGGEQR